MSSEYQNVSKSQSVPCHPPLVDNRFTNSTDASVDTQQCQSMEKVYNDSLANNLQIQKLDSHENGICKVDDNRCETNPSFLFAKQSRKRKRVISLTDHDFDNSTKKMRMEDNIGFIETIPVELKKRIILSLKEENWRIQVSKYWYELYFETVPTLLFKSENTLKSVNTVLSRFSSKKNTQLSNIAIWGSYFDMNHPPVNDFTFNTISMFKSTLVKLIIGRGMNIVSCSSESFRNIFQCKHLRVIEIDYANVDIDAFEGVENLTELEIFRVRGISICAKIENDENDGVLLPLMPAKSGGQSSRKSIFSRFQGLSKLQRFGLWIVKGEISILELFYLQKLQNINEIIVSNVIIPHYLTLDFQTNEHNSSCNNIENVHIDQIFDMLDQKKKLNHVGLFFANNQMRTIDTKNFAKLLNIRALKSLHLGGWILNHMDMLELKYNTTLETFSISCAIIPQCIFNSLVDTKVNYLRFCNNNMSLVSYDNFSKCKNIEKLEFSNVSGMSDIVLNEISKHQEIKSLTLIGIQEFTDHGITSIVNMNNLRELVIKQCRNVTEFGISYIETNHHNSLIDLLKIDYVQYNDDQ